MEKLRFRQVHLDFHTSECIKEIGQSFEKEQFQNLLIKGHVNSITLFSKCHHGWAYHPTKVHQVHPHLSFDLLKAQMEACKEIGVYTPVYISSGLDEKEAVKHPEWLVRHKDESTTWVSDFISLPGYHLLCFNTGYMELLLAQIEEVMQVYQPEGIFLDIASPHPCYCSRCRAEIIESGKDPRDMEAVMEQAERVYANYAGKVKETVQAYNPKCTIFHNGGHIRKGRRDIVYANTHLEVESLPTGGWGYDHFPMSASYVGGLNMEYLGMTGKFHNSWGEFGGFKHPNALRYETALSLAFGAKCSIGDQLHPTGEMDINTYELIGSAYKEIEDKEEWCKETETVVDIGILSDEAVNGKLIGREAVSHADIGINRMMLEGNYLYQFLDMDSDFLKYKLVILPDRIRITDALYKKLEIYLSKGGKILATGVSGLKEAEDTFAFEFGARFICENSSRPSYIVPEFSFATGRTPHVMYEPSYEIEITDGEKIASTLDSYFNRDLLHFCSHRHTPYGTEAGKVAAVIKNNTSYIGFQIFSDYGKMGSLHLKETVCHVIDRLLQEKSIEVNLPDRGIVTLRHQKREKRFICHLLFAYTTNRGEFDFEGSKKTIEVIEDMVPLYGVDVSIDVPYSIRAVRLVPQNEEIDFNVSKGRLCFTVPKVENHQMIELSYKKSN